MNRPKPNFSAYYLVISDKLKGIAESPILTAFLVLVFTSFVVVGLSLPYYLNNFDEFYEQVLAEAHGMIFDLAIIGILMVWLNKSGEKRLRIRMYKDEIDDFRLWESEEAAFRTVGNIKRLNRNKIYDINLVDSYLAKTNLNHAKLSGSNLNNANLQAANMIECSLDNARLNRTNMEACYLNQANMQEAYASGATFKDAFLIKANLRQAFLIRANFENAFLMEANLQGAYLTEADFTNANLFKADLRDAIGLTIEQLSKAKSLYQAKLDPLLMAELQANMPELVSK